MTTPESSSATAPPAGPRRARFSDLLARAATAISGRALRAAATSLGVLLAVACIVSVVLLAGSAQHAVTYEFDRAKATSASAAIPAAYQKLIDTGRLDALRHRPGVLAVGLTRASTKDAVLRRTPLSLTTQSDVLAIQPAAQNALQLGLISGRMFDAETPAGAALIGTGSWANLGMANRPVPAGGLHLLVNDRPFTIIGVVDSADNTLLTGTTLFIGYDDPAADSLTAHQTTIHVHTTLGATPTVARDLPLVVLPEAPQAIQVDYTPVIGTTQTRVAAQTRALTIGCAAVLAIMGALSIGSSVMSSVRERRSEIGLLRAVGAGRTAVATQFLLEGALIGLLGGILGAVIGFNVAALIAISQTWALIINWPTLLLSPCAGLLLGILAALRPSLNAASTTPATALRQA